MEHNEQLPGITPLHQDSVNSNVRQDIIGME